MNKEKHCGGNTIQITDSGTDGSDTDGTDGTGTNESVLIFNRVYIVLLLVILLK